MAYESARSISLQAAAGGDIPAKRFVTPGATGYGLAAAGADSVGVTLEGYVDADFTAGNETNTKPVAVLDGAKLEVEAGAAITAGDPVESDATGRAVTAGDVADRILGYALEAASGAGEFITIVGLKGGGFAAQS